MASKHDKKSGKKLKADTRKASKADAKKEVARANREAKRAQKALAKQKDKAKEAAQKAQRQLRKAAAAAKKLAAKRKIKLDATTRKDVAAAAVTLGSAAPTAEPSESWTVLALRARAKDVGVTGYSRLSKAKLLERLRSL